MIIIQSIQGDLEVECLHSERFALRAAYITNQQLYDPQSATDLRVSHLPSAKRGVFCAPFFHA